MWKRDSTMDSPLIVRPWTPPETEGESSPRSDCFSDSFRDPDSTYSSFTEHRWPPHRQDVTTTAGARCDTPTEGLHERPKVMSRLTDPAPYTPTKTYALGNAPNAHGALQYPYTPDSSRMVRRSTELASSPPAWDDYSEHSSSPVQNALSSCIAHFENLLQTRQPDEDQMEYVVGQFEAMAAYLSAPESQSKQTDEYLFNDPEGHEPEVTGLGIVDDEEEEHDALQPPLVNEAYVEEVAKYIAGVRKYIEDLKMRLDEVKTLNSIQLDVIHDLRRQMKVVRQGMRTSLDMHGDSGKSDAESEDATAVEDKEEAIAEGSTTSPPEFGAESWETIDNDQHKTLADLAGLRKDAGTQTPPDLAATPRIRTITIIRKPYRRSFWASFGEALDKFGALLLED